MSPKALKLLTVAGIGILFIMASVLGGSFVFINVKNSDREPIKIEKMFSPAEFEVVHVQTVSTRIVVLEADQTSVSVVLEGHFRKSFGDPLLVAKTANGLSLRIDEAQEGSHRSELSVILPRGFSKRLEIETLTGRIDVTVSREVAKRILMSTVSGEKTLNTN